MKITGFAVWAELNDGIYKSDRAAEAERTHYRADQAHYRLALAHAETLGIQNMGNYNIIGAGNVHVAALDEDGNEIDINEGGIQNLPVGELTRDEIAHVSGQFFDGNNFRDCRYPKLEEFTDDPLELSDHCRVIGDPWGDAGFDIQVDDGWKILDSADGVFGNSGWESPDTDYLGDIEDRLEAAGIHYEVAEIEAVNDAGQDDGAVIVLVREADLKAAQKAVGMEE